MRDVLVVGRQDAGAAGRRRLGVAVGVMAEHECHLRPRAQSIAPSSGSVTVTVYGMLLPKANVPPSTGMSTMTVGAVFPTVIVVFADAALPLESITVSLAVNWPVRRVGEGRVRLDRVDRPVAVEVPLEADRVAGSASFEPSLENCTVSGAGPSVGVGREDRRPGRAALDVVPAHMPASGLMAKKPSP